MKKILMMLLTFILIFTTLLPSYTAFSEEMENYCENMFFSVQTVRAGDGVIEGKADPDSEIELEIDDYEDVLIVENNGEFKFEIDAELEMGNKILLTNQQHEIETEVKEVDTEVITIDSELDGGCEVTEELIEENEKIIEEENSEENDDNEPNSDESFEEPLEEDNEDVIDEEADEISAERETVDEETETSDESSEEVSEKTIEEETDESVGEISEDDNNQVSDEEFDVTTEESEVLDEEVETEGKSEGEKVTEEESLENDIPSVSEDTSEPETSDDLIKKEEQEEYLKEEVSDTYNMKDSEGLAEEEMVNENPDKQNLEEETEKEIKTEDFVPEEKSQNKIKEGSNQTKSANETGSELSKREAPTLKSVNTVYQQVREIKSNEVFRVVETEDEFIEALKDRNVEAIKLETNIKLNENIEVKSKTHTKIIEANGKSIDLGSGQLKLNNELWPFYPTEINTMIVRNAENLFTTNKEVHGGFFRKESRSVELRLENVTFNKSNSPSGGKLGSNWEGEIHFRGHNTINTQNGENTLAFRKIVVHENATLELNHQSNGAALHFDRNWGTTSNRDFGMEIKNNSNVILNSRSGVMTSDQGSNWWFDFPIIFDINSGANVIFDGEANYLFQNDDSMDFNIKSTNNVDFINRSNNGRLFSPDNTTTFDVENVSVHGWTGNSMWNELPSHTTGILEKGIFIFDHHRGNEQTIVESMKPIENKENFEKNFTSLMMRIMFSDDEHHMLDLEVNGITDNDTEIRGTTNPGAKVMMLDEESNQYQPESINDEGEFIFKIDKPFKAGDKVRFQSQYNNMKSEEIEVVVTGNKLELESEPEDMIFETTEISSGERIINRNDKDWNIKILNTRENKDWDLHAQATGPLENDNEHTLEGALVFKEDRDTASKNLQERVRISSSKKDEESGTKEISWKDDEGILIEVDPLLVQPDTEYSTTIEWTLTDGP